MLICTEKHVCMHVHGEARMHACTWVGGHSLILPCLKESDTHLLVFLTCGVLPATHPFPISVINLIHQFDNFGDLNHHLFGLSRTCLLTFFLTSLILASSPITPLIFIFSLNHFSFYNLIYPYVPTLSHPILPHITSHL